MIYAMNASGASIASEVWNPTGGGVRRSCSHGKCISVLANALQRLTVHMPLWIQMESGRNELVEQRFPCGNHAVKAGADQNPRCFQLPITGTFCAMANMRTPLSSVRGVVRCSMSRDY